VLGQDADAQFTEEVQVGFSLAGHPHAQTPCVYSAHAEAPRVDGKPPFFYPIGHPRQKQNKNL
jgi:hypothetical protein